MTISWPLSRQQVLDADGRPHLVPRAYFYAAGTTDPLTVYGDPEMTDALPWPVVADGFGRFPRVYLPAGLYREEVRGAYDEPLWNDDGLGEAVATDGGSEPGTVDPTAIATTGDVKWRMDASIQPGWVRMNARTIGGAGSGATELASLSARALYLYLWNTFGDGVAPVTGGRGQTAADDFTAGKPIAVPTMQGLIQVGLDDMGSSAANRLQVSVDLTLTAGLTTATVSDGTRITRRMAISAAGVPAGATVVSRDGNTITMSNPANPGSSGTVAARFSPYGDAQVPGQIGGDIIQEIALANLPADLPDGQVTVNYPNVIDTYYPNTVPIGSGGGIAVTAVAPGAATNTQTTAPQPYNVPISNPGGGVPLTIAQAGRLGTFFMKL